MKKMKKILAMLLALTMVLGMTMTASAETKNTANISVVDIVNGVEKETTAAELKYLQVIEPDTRALTGWKFTSDSIAKYYTDAFGLTDTDENTAAPSEPTDIIKQAAIAMLIKYENKDATIHKDVPVVNAATATQINQALDNVINGATLENMDKIQTVSNAGVYAIKATETGYTYKAMAAYVGFNEVTVDGKTYVYPSLDDVKAYTKRVETKVTKVDNDPDNAVAIGTPVTYTVTTAFPYFNQNDTDKEFKVWDKIKGATYIGLTGESKTATIAIGETQVTDVAFSTLTEGLEEYEAGFVVDLSSYINNENSNAGKTVTVTYQAVANAVDVENGAGTTISGDEIDSNKINLYTGKITLTKVDADNGEVKLADAGFKVYKETGKDDDQKPIYSSALTFKQDVELNNDGTVKKDAEGNEIKIPGQYTYDPEGTVTEVFTKGTEGTVTVKGLDVGTYWFEEKTAPTGYSINENHKKVELTIQDGMVKEENTTTVSAGIFEDTATVEDTKLVSLPSTGGIGTTIFTVAGCGIMIAAAYFFFASRKKENN